MTIATITPPEAAPKAPAKPLSELSWRDGLIFGGAQALALVPGVSRSGGTITAGLLLGYTREAAARYSFLLAIHAVFGSGLFQLAKSVDDFGKGGTPGFGATLVATLVAFVVGYLVIIVFLKIVSTFSYKPFVYYRLGLAALVVILLLTGVLDKRLARPTFVLVGALLTTLAVLPANRAGLYPLLALWLALRFWYWIASR